MRKKGFTLIELIVVIAVIAILASIIAPNAFKAIEKSKISRAMGDAKAFRVGATSYYSDIGFWPPDINRGFDPGFMRPVPWNPDGYGGPMGLVTTGYPADWQARVQATWEGPYVEKWACFTPWKGKYDWNYWPTGATRYGVTVDPGCYVGIQRDYADVNGIPTHSEQSMVNSSFDADGAVNSETQLMMTLL
ncbi:MAG: type II secretion system protein [Candidatus Omnitrophota bacterium]